MPKTAGQGLPVAPASPGDDTSLAPLALLHTLLAQLAATTAVPLAAELVIAMCARAVQASSGAVGRCTDDGQAIEILASSGYAPGVLDRWARLPLDAPLPLPDVVRTGAALFVSTPDELLVRYPQLASTPTQSGAWALAPLIVGERVLGGLILGFAASRSFAPADQLIVTIVAQICAQALERARLAEIEREAREITAATIHQISRAHVRTKQLQQVTAALSEARTPADVATVIAREGLAATGMDAGVVYALLESGQALMTLADAGYPAALRLRHQRIRVTRPSPLAEAVRIRDVVAVTAADELLERWPHLAASQAQSGDQATLAVPLLADGQVLGVMHLASRMPRIWFSDDVALVRTLGHLCGQALQRANLYAAEHASRQATERAAARTARLQAVTASLATALSSTDVAQVIVAQGAAVLGAYAGILVLCHPHAPVLELIASQGYPPGAWGDGTALSLDAPLPIADAARTGTAVWLRDPEDYAAHYPH
ncbi:MAG: GAF domain-containing protein, partial [Chloroflexales bacterium]|nr:GAF domain-containing protein [Chloroflexales bacterium]